MITKKEREIIMFVYKYRIVFKDDILCFFDSQKYYRVQIANILKKECLRKRDDDYLVLGDVGIKYITNLGYDFKRLTHPEQYVDRLKNISHIAASFYNNSHIEFIPSTDIKDKSKFTICSRRYIGICRIDKKDYLTYYISKDHTDKYVSSVFFDIQKEKHFRDIIIFTEDIAKIPINEYKFGLDEIFIIPYTNNSKNLLTKSRLIDWYKILCDVYLDEKIYISKYNLIDYTTNRNRFINVFAFIDSEKIHSCKLFLQENQSKELDIICTTEILDIIKQELPKANYKTIDLNNYIKEQTKYD